MYILEEFYAGLDEKVIYGAKCSKCEKVYFPPKIRCQDCLEKIEELIELPHSGVLKNYLENPNSKRHKKNQKLFALVQIDKSDTPVIMRIFNATPKKLKPGMKVKVVWADGKLTDSPHIVGFEPIDIE